MKHLSNRRGGQGDLRRFATTCTPDFGQCFLNEQLTSLFRKMFMGIRRELRGEAWTFRAEGLFALYQLLNVGQITQVRRLPLVAGVSTPPEQSLPLLGLSKDKRKFRDWYFAGDESLMLLEYGPRDFGQELRLACLLEAMEPSLLTAHPSVRLL
jgi:hypothetical protein